MINPSLAGAIPNDSWITKNDVPDPEVLPELPGYHVLVRPVTIKAETKGGIILPEKARDDIAYLTTVGRVLKVGELAYEDREKFLGGAWCRVGDYVCYQKLTGTKFVYKGIKLLLLFDDQIIMKVDNPEDLDTTLVLGG
jgi:co-chaperonin GroES (HSP10)